LAAKSSSPTQDLIFATNLHDQDLTFHSTWGLFSPKAVDEGTRLLANHLKVPPNAVALDLGCGYGPLGLTIAKLAPQGNVHLVDKDFVAVEYAAKNAVANHLSNTQVYLSNGFSHVPAGLTFDLIVSNLPAKISGELLEIFLNDAHSRLKPGGRLYVVTISGLKEYIKRHLASAFGNYDKLAQSKTYTAACSQKTKGRPPIT
jgi:16S rRNA (guanine1207-N2)-methyltransferase